MNKSYTTFIAWWLFSSEGKLGRFWFIAGVVIAVALNQLGVVYVSPVLNKLPDTGIGTVVTVALAFAYFFFLYNTWKIGFSLLVKRMYDIGLSSKICARILYTLLIPLVVDVFVRVVYDVDLNLMNHVLLATVVISFITPANFVTSNEEK